MDDTRTGIGPTLIPTLGGSTDLRRWKDAETICR